VTTIGGWLSRRHTLIDIIILTDNREFQFPQIIHEEVIHESDRFPFLPVGRTQGDLTTDRDQRLGNIIVVVGTVDPRGDGDNGINRGVSGVFIVEISSFLTCLAKEN
jgi:hypothetical protein